MIAHIGKLDADLHKFAQSQTSEKDITLRGLHDIVRETYGEKANEILDSRVQCVT